jgi:hypothetical protein
MVPVPCATCILTLGACARDMAVVLCVCLILWLAATKSSRRSSLLDELSIDERDSDRFVSIFVVCSTSDSSYNPTDPSLVGYQLQSSAHVHIHPYISIYLFIRSQMINVTITT